MSDYSIFAGMSKPTLCLTLLSAGTPIDLTGATVRLYVTNDSDGTHIVNGETMTKDNAQLGQVSYTFTAAETAIQGNYHGQAEIEYSDTNKERTHAFRIIIGESL